MKHIAKRFLLHFLVAGPVWLAVYFLGALPISQWSHEPKILAVALMMLVIAIREIVDASKLAKIRGDLLKIIANAGTTGRIAELIDDTFNDPRYTLKKSIYDLIGWASGVALIIWLWRW